MVDLDFEIYKFFVQEGHMKKGKVKAQEYTGYSGYANISESSNIIGIGNSKKTENSPAIVLLGKITPEDTYLFWQFAKGLPPTFLFAQKNTQDEDDKHLRGYTRTIEYLSKISDFMNYFGLEGVVEFKEIRKVLCYAYEKNWVKILELESILPQVSEVIFSRTVLESVTNNDSNRNNLTMLLEPFKNEIKGKYREVIPQRE